MSKREVKNLSSLQGAVHLISRAQQVGFQWKDWRGPLKKVREELRELEYEIKNRGSKEKLSGEVGDLLFSVINLGIMLKLNPEKALSSTLKKFEVRFKWVEKALKKKGRTPKGSNLKEMQALWEKAKIQLKGSL